jgi:hypothetical protein
MTYAYLQDGWKTQPPELRDLTLDERARYNITDASSTCPNLAAPSQP